MRYSLLALACACSHSTTPTIPAPVLGDGPKTVKRNVVFQGRLSGTVVSTYDHDTIKTTLHILENGRGPHVEAELRLADDGTILKLEAHGHHTMGTKVEETFKRVAEGAKWDSEEEHGEVKDISGPVMFVPQADLAELEPLLVRAALKAGGTIALLPGGEAHVAKVAEVILVAHGESRKLSCYAITGLFFTPDYTWMNEDGTWFGSVDVTFSEVPEGWDAAVAPLVTKQQELIAARDAALATAQAHRPPAAGLAYTHARVLDVEHGKWLADQTVVVIGDKITAVDPRAKIPAGAEVVDLAGRALIPGLVDMHAHLGDSDGVLNIASGVTTVRDVGNDPDKLDDFKQRWDAGTAIGPHVFRMGFVEGRNEKAASSRVTAETPDEAKAAVAFFVARHYDGMKIYNSIRPELIPIITAEAHAHGMTVTGHIPVHVLANEAVRAGYDGIEHINMLFLNFFATHDTDTRDTTRFTLVGDHAAELDLKSAPVREFLALLKEHHTIIDPTADAFEDLFAAVPGKITPGLEALVARMPATVQRGFLAGGLPLSGDKHALYLRSWAKMLAMIKLVHDEGILEVAGTDTIAGLMLTHELALFVQAGISPAAALKMATLDAARALGVDKTTGSITPGKVADLVVIDGDPVARIDDITHVVTTMKAGTVFTSAPLYESVGVRPAI
jgi:imidazolonepropionase-like amidohydrolase